MNDIVCTACGTHAQSGGAFCGGCGAFLEWEGERVAAASEVIHEADPVAPVVPAPSEATAPASSQLPPVTSEAEAADEAAKKTPVAIQPALPKERPKPAPVPRASRNIEGAIYCGSCGEANTAERRFCRRCGAALEAVATPAVRLPWWQRIFRRRPPSTVPATGRSSAAAPTGPATPQAAGGPTAPKSPRDSAGPPPSNVSTPKVPGVSTPSGPRPPTAISRASGPGGSSYHAPSTPRSLGVSNLSKRPSLPRRGGVVGKVIGVVVVLGIVAVAAVPSLRHDVTSKFQNIVTRPQAIPLASVLAKGLRTCPKPVLGQDNATLYWYTRPVGHSQESVTVRVAPSFTGSVSSIVFTPLVANPSTSLAGASPHPVSLDLIATPSDTTTVINLRNPPVLQSVAVSIPRPSAITLKLVSSDVGAARGTCAETGVVFKGKNG